MFESRCGILCNSCESKEEVGCKGCLNMDKTFWGGICEVKSCVESKGYNHCGDCKEFPCEITSNMGKEEGFDVEGRLNNIRKWRNEEN